MFVRDLYILNVVCDDVIYRPTCFPLFKNPIHLSLSSTPQKVPLHTPSPVYPRLRTSGLRKYLALLR